MNKIFLTYVTVGLVGICMLLLPHDSYAAELSFKVVPNNVTGDGATIVEVRIDPQSKNLNVVEGVINFRGPILNKLSVKNETGGSVLTLWPTAPDYNSGENAIRFVGGVPGGFDHEGLLFRLRLFSTSSGDVTISWIGGIAYLNDGKGTKENISAKSITINLDKQDQAAVSKTSQDNTPPYFDSIEVGRDPSVYDGKYFVSFHALDDVSGVTRYEIKEGEIVTTIIDGTYVLNDQKRKTEVTVTAFDAAGNSKTVEISPKSSLVKGVMIILLLIAVLVVILRYGYKKIFKK